jgi:hypothetical protein
MPWDLDGFFTSPEFLTQLATYITTLLTALFAQLLGGAIPTAG